MESAQMCSVVGHSHTNPRLYPTYIEQNQGLTWKIQHLCALSCHIHISTNGRESTMFIPRFHGADLIPHYFPH